MLVALSLLLMINAGFAVQAQTLKVGAGWSRPPYIISETESGFEIELVRAVLGRLGHSIKVVSFPHNHIVQMLNHDQLDIALTINADSGVKPNHLSDVYIVYQNVALTLKDRKLNIDQLSALSQLSVVAFQSARNALGKDFANAIKDNPLYVEMADQSRQIELLLQGQVDVIVLDINVFNYLSKALMGSNELKSVTIHALFPLNRYSAGFKDLELKNQFNQELGVFVQSGEYEKLLSRYDYHLIDPGQYKP